MRRKKTIAEPNSFQLNMQLEPFKSNRLHVMGIVLRHKAGSRDKVAPRCAKSLSQTSQLPLPGFKGRTQVNPVVNTTDRRQFQTHLPTLKEHKESARTNESKRCTQTLNPEERVRQIAEILLGGIYRHHLKLQHNSSELSESSPDTITQNKTDV